MFLSINLGESEPVKENKVDVLILMHGRQTASSMLEMAQELLGTKVGKLLICHWLWKFKQCMKKCYNMSKLSRAFDEWPTLVNRYGIIKHLQ